MTAFSIECVHFKRGRKTRFFSISHWKLLYIPNKTHCGFVDAKSRLLCCICRLCVRHLKSYVAVTLRLRRSTQQQRRHRMEWDERERDFSKSLVGFQVVANCIEQLIALEIVFQMAMWEVEQVSSLNQLATEGQELINLLCASGRSCCLQIIVVESYLRLWVPIDALVS